jgi:tetratricopeptide (TPR) repeat protein/tRNA A-37 threonylcarbamoyl transferase component Bud32
MAEAPPQPAEGAVELADLTGTTVGRFHIRARLGAGGMGEVYRAEDTVLKRAVALKRMAPHLRDDPSSRRRFLHEAERASRLNDPHIAGIYDVLQESGEVFLVMEFIEGETLRRRLNQPMSLDTFLDLAVQCAHALAAAHENGILHRDIKPENIMLTRSGQAKILDFGVAREILPLEESPTVSAQSRSVAFSGTLAYMAPEILMEQEADARADIFSLGVVLYETLTGRHPFRAEGVMATADRIRHEEPTPPSEFIPAVPAELERILSKMLAKNRDARYATAADLVVDLRALQGKPIEARAPAAVAARRLRLSWRAVAAIAVAVGLLIALAFIPSTRNRLKELRGLGPLPREKQVVVLPFTVVNRDAESVATGAGLTVTLTAKLTQLTADGSLQVVPASEVRARNIATPDQARKEFSANLVLENSVQKSGGQVQVNCVLVDARTLRGIRADSTTVAAGDFFALERQVVERWINMLELKVPERTRQALESPGTLAPGAYHYYLQGRGYLQEYDKTENITSAISVFQQALALDPNYALAHAGLGEAYWEKYRSSQDIGWIPKSRQACERALAIDATLAAGHICLGKLYTETGEYAKAVAQFERALEAEPTSDAAYLGLAHAYEPLGKLLDAEKTYRRAIGLRPNYWAGYSWLGVFYFYQGRYGDAAQMFKQVVRLAPDSVRGHYNVGAAYLEQGNYAEAIPWFERSVAIRPTGSAYSNIATAYFFQHKFAEAARYYEEALKLDPRDYLFWRNLGDAYYWIPEKRNQAADAYKKVITLAKEKLNVNPNDADALAHIAVCAAMLGEKELARDSLGKAVKLGPDRPEVFYKAALIAGQFGETQPALDWLEKALAGNISPIRVRNDPFFNKLHGNAKFESLLRGH